MASLRGPAILHPALETILAIERLRPFAVMECSYHHHVSGLLRNIFATDRSPLPSNPLPALIALLRTCLKVLLPVSSWPVRPGFWFGHLLIRIGTWLSLFVIPLVSLSPPPRTIVPVVWAVARMFLLLPVSAVAPRRHFSRIIPASTCVRVGAS
jgi:hypothetical protein